MKGLIPALYSAFIYVLFLVTFLYTIGFVEGVVVPKTIDSGEAGGLWASLAVDTVLLGIFAVQHSLMARPGFKRVWTKLVPEVSERSTYVLFASSALALLLWQWRPLPAPIWTIEDPLWAGMVLGLSWTGWGVVLLSTFLISHFHLFGLSQGFARLFRLQAPKSDFTTPLFYKWIRHPLYLGFLMAFWAAPRMSLGHLFFAIATTGYILIGIWFEERDLVGQFGERYIRYRGEAGMLFPRLPSARKPDAVSVTQVRRPS